MAWLSQRFSMQTGQEMVMILSMGDNKMITGYSITDYRVVVALAPVFLFFVANCQIWQLAEWLGNWQKFFGNWQNSTNQENWSQYPSRTHDFKSIFSKIFPHCCVDDPSSTWQPVDLRWYHRW